MFNMENTILTESTTTTSSYLSTEETSSFLNLDYLSSLNNNFTGSSETYPSTDPAYHVLGSRRDALYIVLPITIIYLSIFFTGTMGNVSTCIVIARNKSMHTATNYYLFSLAVSDLLLLISGLPAEVYLVWSKYPYVFGEGFCILRGLAAECSTNASVLTITAFTVERYVAICHPFLSHTMSKLSRAIKLVLIIWLVALCFAIPQALQFGIVEHRDISPNFVICTLRVVVIKHSFELSTFLFFIVPMTLITVLYAMIGLKLRQSNMMKRDNGTSRSIREISCSAATPTAAAASTTVVVDANSVKSSSRKEQNCRHHTGRSSRRVLKMLVAVVVAFFICWAPFHVQRLIAIYGTDNDHVTSNGKWMEFLYLLFTYVSGVLYYVSATINPILYNIMSNKFREAFVETLARSCGRSRFPMQQEQRSYSSLSRSQRGTGAGFGSRAAGTAGTGLVQDSTEYSGNSVRDDSIKRSTTVDPRSDVATTNLDVTCDSASRLVVNGNTSGSTRRIGSNGNHRTRCEARINLLNSSNQAPMTRGQIQDSIASGERPEIAGPWHDCVNNKLSNDSSASTKNNNRINSTTNSLSSQHRSHCHRNSFRLDMIGSDDTLRRKKWWRFFKWFPDAKVFKFGAGRTRYASPGDGMVSDIECNREEYSMTSCHNGDHRPV